MHLRTVGGDPSPGNPDFGVQLLNAPGGSQVSYFLKPFGCAVGLPFLCGTVYAAPGLIGPFILPNSGAGCAASSTLPLPLPPDSTLCGLRVCVQSIIACPVGPTVGVGMSGAIDFNLTQT